MPKRVVIADAGPLIGLARIGQLALLPRLFGTVTVTSWVRQEVLAGGNFPDTRALQEAFSQSWLQMVDITGNQDLINLHQIDMGEATAITLAQQLHSVGDLVLLLMDDQRGRQAAQHSGFTTMGTAGLLVLAKKAGAIEAVKPLLQALHQKGYFLSQRLMDAVLIQADEALLSMTGTGTGTGLC